MKGAIRKLAKKGRQTEFVWRYGFNFLPTLNYGFDHSKKANSITQKIVSELNRNGIAKTSIEECLGEIEYFPELELAVADLLDERSEEIHQMKARANDADAIGDKTFNIELLGSNLTFDPNSIFVKFALQETLLDIANAYFGMFAKLRYYNVWNTFATQSEARESQLWHFDREDNYILKVFLYLNDVDEGAGPFTYAPKTHRKGSLRGVEPEYFLEENVRRTKDEQMDAVISKKDWIKATGKKGTIVFADTRGYHKGGEAKTHDRLMFTCMFTSPASDSKRLLSFPDSFDRSKLNKKQLLALQIDQ